MPPKFKKLITLSSIIIFSSIILSACNKNISDNDLNLDQTPVNNQSAAVSPTATIMPNKNNSTQYMEIKTKYGPITIKLFSEQTPNTVANFINKSNNKYFDGLIFHRVEPDFVVQGGDPLGNGTGGGSISSELNNIPFKLGSVGLARTPASREISNDSQFFICLSTEICQQLTGDYVNFGEVISGFENVQKIQVGDKMLEVNIKE